jgi:hypothetical protein
MSKDRLFIFNRRTVEDQRIYVLAASRKEAEAKARADEAEDTDDVEIRKSTYRFLEETPR